MKILFLFLLVVGIGYILRPKPRRFRNHPDSNMSDMDYYNENEPNK